MNTFIENEDDALLKFAPNWQGGYSLVNKHAKNRWAILRGYAIHPGFTTYVHGRLLVALG